MKSITLMVIAWQMTWFKSLYMFSAFTANEIDFASSWLPGCVLQTEWHNGNGDRAKYRLREWNEFYSSVLAYWHTIFSIPPISSTGNSNYVILIALGFIRMMAHGHHQTVIMTFSNSFLHFLMEYHTSILWKRLKEVPVVIGPCRIFGNGSPEMVWRT